MAFFTQFSCAHLNTSATVYNRPVQARTTGSGASITFIPEGGGSHSFGRERWNNGKRGGRCDVLWRAVKYTHTVYNGHVKKENGPRWKNKAGRSGRGKEKLDEARKVGTCKG